MAQMVEAYKYEPIVERNSEENFSPSLPYSLTQLVHATFLRVSIVTITICTVLDISLILYLIIFDSGSSAHHGVLPEPLETLSTYMNLDELYATKIYTTRHLPIINLPRNYFQVSSIHPQAHFPYWTSMNLTTDGNITLAEYHFVVTPEVSTVGQFRAIDYGMENCSLRFKTPQKNSTTVNINIGGGNAMLDIWQLSMNKPLTGTVSWDSKPPRNRLVSTTNLFYGTNTTLFTFRCVPGTFHTYEVACHGASCYVDGTWWNGAPFYILQSQTLGLGA